MEGKWLIADRDVNEREGLKWLLKSSSIPVTNIFLAANFQDFVMLFEQESPDIVMMEIDMIAWEEWTSFRELIQIYEPVLLLTSAEATFEKARLAIDLQALDLLIKPFSTTKVSNSFQKAAQKLTLKHNGDSLPYPKQNQTISYETLFISQNFDDEDDYNLAAFQTEKAEKVETLYSFLLEYPFKNIYGIFVLTDLVVVLFKKSNVSDLEQCQKVMRRWEEEFTDPLAIVVHYGKSIPLHQKYVQIRKMLQLSYYHGYRQVMEFANSPHFEHIDPFLASTEQREWIDMLTAGEIEKIKMWLYEEFLQLSDPLPDPGLVRIRLTSILAQIRRFMKTYNLNEQQTFEKEYRYIFNSILYDTVLYRTVQNLVLFTQKIFDGAKSHNQSLKKDPIELGISFIEANFANSTLKLEDVAHFVDRNPAYFSHLLTTKTGTSFIDILVQVRIKQAKRLLVETTKSIKEISTMVGFRNSNYFSKMFRDTVGLSPRNYRMNKHVKAQFDD